MRQKGALLPLTFKKRKRIEYFEISAGHRGSVALCAGISAPAPEAEGLRQGVTPQ